MTAAAVGPSLQARADALQQSLNKQILTSTQVIDANKLGPIPCTPEGISRMYALFPSKEVEECLRRVYCCERIREAVLEQVSPEDPNDVSIYLTGQFGYGACGEMAHHAYVRGAAYANTMLVGCESKKGRSDGNHAFAVFHADWEQLAEWFRKYQKLEKAPSPLALLSDLPRGAVVVDPFFQFAAELPRETEKLAPLDTYIRQRQITEIFFLNCLKKESERCAQILQRARDLYPKIQAAGAVTALTRLFADTAWKQNKKEEGKVRVFATVSTQKATAIVERLAQARIDASASRLRGEEEQDKRVVMLVNPSLGALWSLAAPLPAPAKPTRSP